MPTTRPRTLNLGGVQISVTADRLLAERIKGTWGLRHLLGRRQLHRFQGDEPVINGTRVEDIDWYHTLELPGGVVTDGFVDHRPHVAAYRIPDTLTGLRCLDVATFDGFWALEMERRGAAEVVAIDVHSRADCDYPKNFEREYLGWKAPHEPFPVKGVGFAYARRALGSGVRRKVLSVYELSPRRVGLFDVVFLSDLLLHLRDPLRALEALYTVTRPGGLVIIADVYDPQLEAASEERAARWDVVLDDYSGCHWWTPTVSALKAMIEGARFAGVEERERLVVDTKWGMKVHKVVFHARRGGDQ